MHRFCADGSQLVVTANAQMTWRHVSASWCWRKHTMSWGYRDSSGEIVAEIDMANDVAKMGVDLELVAVQSSNLMRARAR